jgi:hypothetical protein
MGAPAGIVGVRAWFGCAPPGCSGCAVGAIGLDDLTYGSYRRDVATCAPGEVAVFQVDHDGASWRADVVVPPAPEIQHPLGVAVGAAQSVAYADLHDADDPATYTIHTANPAFYVVTQVGGTTPGVTCQSLPGADPADWLPAVSSGEPIGPRAFPLPVATCFPDAAADGYVVTLVATNHVSAGSDAISPGLGGASGAVAGAASAAALVLAAPE